MYNWSTILPRPHYAGRPASVEAHRAARRTCPARMMHLGRRRLGRIARARALSSPALCMSAGVGWRSALALRVLPARIMRPGRPCRAQSATARAFSASAQCDLAERVPRNAARTAPHCATALPRIAPPHLAPHCAAPRCIPLACITPRPPHPPSIAPGTSRRTAPPRPPSHGSPPGRADRGGAKRGDVVASAQRRANTRGEQGERGSRSTG